MPSSDWLKMKDNKERKMPKSVSASAHRHFTPPPIRSGEEL